MSKAGGSKADTAVKIVLIFFISLLSFTVGTLVGGQFEKSKSYQMSLENGSTATESSDAEAAPADSAAAPISDEDIEGLEDFVKSGEKAEREVASEHGSDSASAAAHAAEEGHAPAAAATAHNDGYVKHGAAKAEATAKAEAHAETASAAHEETKEAAPAHAAQRLAADKAPMADVKKAPREPSNTLPAVATSVIGKYTVQVASYATEAEAKGHATRLNDKGFSAFYIPAEVNGKMWYRVSIGRFDDQKTATAHRKEILDAQAATSAIVQKILK